MYHNSSSIQSRVPIQFGSVNNSIWIYSNWLSVGESFGLIRQRITEHIAIPPFPETDLHERKRWRLSPCGAKVIQDRSRQTRALKKRSSKQMSLYMSIRNHSRWARKLQKQRINLHTASCCQGWMDLIALLACKNIRWPSMRATSRVLYRSVGQRPHVLTTRAPV